MTIRNTNHKNKKYPEADPLRKVMMYDELWQIVLVPNLFAKSNVKNMYYVYQMFLYLLYTKAY